MEDIRFYNFAFQPVFILHDVISVNWTFYFNDIGTFELHAAARDDLLEVLSANPYLVAVQGQKQAVITGRRIHMECVLYGRTLNWLLTRRTVAPFSETVCNVAAGARQWVLEAFVDVSNFSATDLVQSSKNVSMINRTHRTVSELVRECLSQDMLGHRVVFDIPGGMWRFEVCAGNVNPIIISEGNRSAYDVEYSESILEYYSGGWYENQSEAGDDPVWTYLTGDAEKTGIFRWECPLSGTNEGEAESELAKKKRASEVRAKVRTLRYGIEYQLGDLVYLQMEKGGFMRRTQKRVTGVHIWYENQGCGEEPIFEEA